MSIFPGDFQTYQPDTNETDLSADQKIIPDPSQKLASQQLPVTSSYQPKSPGKDLGKPPKLDFEKIGERRTSALVNSVMTSSFRSLDYTFNNTHPDIADDFRFALGSFWIPTTEKQDGVRFFHEIADRKSVSGKPQIRLEDVTINTQHTGALGGNRSTITVSSRPSFNIADFFDGLGRYHGPIILGNRTLFDLTFEYRAPLNSEKNIEETRYKRWDVDSHYNFFVDQYEDASGQESTPERALPNLYSMVDETSTENVDSQVHQQNTLGGRIDPLFAKAKQSKEEMGLFSHGQFLDIWGHTAQDMGLVDFLPFTNPYENIFFRTRDQLSEEYRHVNNEYQHLFPFYNRITFDTDSTTQFAQMLHEAQLSNSFIDQFHSASLDGQEFYQSRASVLDFEDRLDFRHEREFRRGNTWYLNPWIESLSPDEDLPEVPDQENVIRLTLDEKGNIPKFMNIIMRMALLSTLENMKEIQMRDFEELLNGEKAPSEIVMYEIRKHRAFGEDQIEPQKVQSIFFLNSNDKEIIDYIDTQVKFEQGYEYSVFSYHLVVGNEYEYIPPNTNDPQSGQFTFGSNKNQAIFDVINDPSFWLVQQHLFTEDFAFITDDPPLYPDVSFRPYNNSDNKLLITMQKQIGSRMEEPILVEDDDQNQFPTTTTEEIKFQTDSVVTEYEIFRLDQKPESYADFADARKITVTTELEQLDSFSDRAAFKDTLSPNQTYYYIFRSVDVHDKLSNPSKVYEVELRSEQEVVIPRIEPKTIEELNPTPNKHRSVRQFLEIDVPTDQKIPDLQKSKLSGPKRQIVLSKKEAKTWNQKYKLRLTSKSTGKSVDLNFDFDYRQKLPLRMVALENIDAKKAKVNLKVESYPKFEKFFKFDSLPGYLP